MTSLPRAFGTLAATLLIGATMSTQAQTPSASTPSASAPLNPADPTAPISMVQEWDKIFPKSDRVQHRKITFRNRYGITLVGDLYIPKNASGRQPAIAVSGPFGAVKEQSSGLHAQTLAERGFVTLAFDGSYTGESGGQPRNVASPDINTEDFSAAVDALGQQPEVDRDRIGILGICGWGGFALNAAVADARVKAVAVSTMYDMTRVMARGYNDSIDATARQKMRRDLGEARWTAAGRGLADQGSPAAHLPPPEALTDETPLFVRQYSDFYKTRRGFHPRSVNSNGAWTTTTPLSFVNMPILQYAAELQTPALVVHGEKAHSRYFGEDAFKALGSQDKELLIVPGATHTDLYDDKAGKIPYDRFETFYRDRLK